MARFSALSRTVLPLLQTDTAPILAARATASGRETILGVRALPFKAQLVDADGAPVTDAELGEPPVIQIAYQAGVAADSEDVSADALPVGQGTEGNQFEFAGNKWQYNLKLRNFTGTGTYVVTMERADAFFIQPTCEGRFVVE